MPAAFSFAAFLRQRTAVRYRLNRVAKPQRRQSSSAGFRREKPFEGLTIAVSVHLEAKTANLGLVLREGGAQVYLTGCNPLSPQDDVAAAMASLGVETFGVHGVDMRGYEDLLTETLKCRPHLIVAAGRL